MRTLGSAVSRYFARTLVLVLTLSAFLGGRAYAATDWSAIQTALGAKGQVFHGDALHVELVRQDLAISVNGQPEPNTEVAIVANGFIGFKQSFDGSFFVDGSLPAQESELNALQIALRQDSRIHITGVVNHTIQESPKLIWVHFVAHGGSDIATSLATALLTIKSPQIGVSVVPGTDNIIPPGDFPPQFMQLLKTAYLEQLTDIFAVYLPRPDEHWLFTDRERGNTALGVGHSFYIQFSFSGGTQATINAQFALRGDEVQDVEDVLRAGGFTITSQSNHFINDWPHLYYVDATATSDNGFQLGSTLYDATVVIQAHIDEDRDHDHDKK